jgi:hypothetical protein
VEFEEYDTPETRTENGVAAMPGWRRGGVVQGLGRQPGRRCSSLRRISRVSELPRRVAYLAPSRLTHSELVDLRGASHQGGVDSEPR